MKKERQTITLYIRWLDPETRQMKPMRRVLQNVFFTDAFVEALMRSGTIPTESALCTIFRDPKLRLVEPQEWQETPLDKLDNLWTFRGTDLNQTFPILVPYETPFDGFVWEANSQNAELNFIRATPNALRVTKATPHRYGTSPNVVLNG